MRIGAAPVSGTTIGDTRATVGAALVHAAACPAGPFVARPAASTYHATSCVVPPTPIVSCDGPTRSPTAGPAGGGGCDGTGSTSELSAVTVTVAESVHVSSVAYTFV